MMERRHSPDERRRGRRAPFVASVRQRSGGQVQLALAQNLGEHGMELKRLPAALPAHVVAPLELMFEIPDGGGMIRARATIVFDRREGAYHTTGVRFAALSPEDRARILRYLATL
jgi:hypothetical protein